jgi:gelsolin
VQHRQVSGHESTLFLGYFAESGGIKLLSGGAASGFNKIKPTEYKPRLLHLKGRKKIRVEQVPFELASLNSGDVFVLDAGLTLYQWQGKKAGMNEKARAGQLCRNIDDERSGKPEVEVFTQGDSDEAEFLSQFPGYSADAPPVISDESGDDLAWEKTASKTLFQLSDSSGDLEFKEVAKGKVTKDLLSSDDVFIFDIGCEIFSWVGKGASAEEKKGALHYAQQYIINIRKMPELPICKIIEGGENEVFNTAFDK